MGKTPLEMIRLVKEQYPEFANQPISYAGRLDPLAHGVLLLMVGEAVRERAKHLDQKKSYTFELLFGAETDSYDYLGLLHSTHLTEITSNVNLYVNSFVNTHLGKQKQYYPPFSSKPVEGKPLFWWAKQGRLHEITLPTRDIEIYSFVKVSEQTVQVKDLETRIVTNINLVQGDFRQAEIIKQWQIFFTANAGKQLQLVNFSVHCSSGTYIRQLVHELGQTIGCGAIAIDILRTAVGEYVLEDAIRLAIP